MIASEIVTGVEKYIVLVIVVWRITHLLSAEDGPFDIVFKVRKWMGNSFFGKLMDCFYCLSIWIGLLAAVYAGRTIMEMILLCFYYSGASILLEKMTNKKFT
ncbi:MAG TPA: DUF1360 domain-containing protein [Chitinophagaceae bacterium]|jgi:hypothetical protein|nr:DUF1360 domain-containing protein [Chitinophagaceae bacterium]